MAEQLHERDLSQFSDKSIKNVNQNKERKSKIF